MDAIKLLKEDHKKMKKSMEELDSTTERGVKTREELFTKMQDELSVHERIEEEIFYPALMEHPKTKEIVLEGFEEHHAVDVLLDELQDVPFSDERWAAKFTVVKENIEHHIEEEEGDMFVKARRLLGDEELTELGERMQERRSALVS